MGGPFWPSHQSTLTAEFSSDRFQGYNKGATSSKPHAPWDGSTFAVEWESNKSEQQSEYNKTYYAKPVRKI